MENLPKISLAWLFEDMDDTRVLGQRKVDEKSNVFGKTIPACASSM